MFDEYAEKFKEIHANVPKTFKRIARKGANFAVNKAKDLTKEEKLVDTGNYKRNWVSSVIEFEEGIYGIKLENNVEYASFLEEGHAIKGGGRYKGRFVGRRTLDDTDFYCLEQLETALEKAFRAYHESFVKPKE